MSKIRTTAKAIREMPEPKVQVGYCGLQTLLRFRGPFAYTAGKYGWNFDAYDLGGLIVCTGYRNMPGATADDLAREYEGRAEDFRAEHSCNSDAQRPEFERLIAEFKAEVLQRIA